MKQINRSVYDLYKNWCTSMFDICQDDPDMRVQFEDGVDALFKEETKYIRQLFEDGFTYILFPEVEQCLEMVGGEFELHIHSSKFDSRNKLLTIMLTSEMNW